MNHLAEDNDVVTADDLYLGTPENLDGAVEFYNTTAFDDDLPTGSIDVVLHLAVLSSYKIYEGNLTKGTRVNIEDPVDTVEQARKDGCGTVVYATTSPIYGSRTGSSPEDVPVEPRTGYEASKLGRERYAEHFHHHYDIQLTGVRFFSAYQGSGDTEEHKGEPASMVA